MSGHRKYMTRSDKLSTGGGSYSFICLCYVSLGIQKVMIATKITVSLYSFTDRLFFSV